MSNYIVTIGKNFTPLFKGAKAELCVMKGDDGGPQAIAQFYNPQKAKEVATLLERKTKMERVLRKLIDEFPEMETDEPINGSDAVDVLCSMWDEIKEAVAEKP